LTIREWLKTLPEPIRTQALTNLESEVENANRERDSLASAIGGAFTWSESPEGHTYWSFLQSEACQSGGIFRSKYPIIKTKFLDGYPI